jgi:hypothetical protein
MEVRSEGRERAEKMRQEGLARARSIIANAEREAKAVIQAAREAAEAAEGEARTRATAILSGEPTRTARKPDQQAPASPSETASAKILPLPSNDGTLRFRIRGPMSFASMLQLKRDISALSGIAHVTVAPAERGGDALIALTARDPDSFTRELQSLVGTPEARR